MLQSEDRATFLKAVAAQIRWKRAQPVVLEELASHIEDQRTAYIEGGMAEGDAEKNAIREMGDPVTVGQQLDRAHRPKPDIWLLAATGILLLAGLAAQYFVAPEGNVQWALRTQLVWIGISIVGMLAAYFSDFTILSKHPVALYAVINLWVFLEILSGPVLNGRAINAVYPLLLIPTAFAGLVYHLRGKGYTGILLCGAAFLLPAVQTFRVPSVSMLLILSVSSLAVLTGAVMRGWFHVARRRALLLIYTPVAAVFAMTLGQARVRARLYEALTARDVHANWITVNIRQILGASQQIGTGEVVEGLTDMYTLDQLLPRMHVDYILTSLTYQFGFIIMLTVLLLFGLFFSRAVSRCRRQNSVLGYMTSLSVVMVLGMQAVVYITSNLGIGLFTPLILPFMSYAGRGMVINLLITGFLLSVFRADGIVRDGAPTAVFTPSRRIRFENGCIIIDTKSLIKRLRRSRS